MKILTFKYNRMAAAICTSTLMSDEAYACKDLFKLSVPTKPKKYAFHTKCEKKNQEYVISGTWQ